MYEINVCSMFHCSNHGFFIGFNLRNQREYNIDMYIPICVVLAREKNLAELY